MTEQDSHRVLVLTQSEEVPEQLDSMCRALDIGIMPVTSHHDLPFRLHHCRPMAVVSELDPQSLASCAALRCIAAYNPDMPVLLVSGDDPAAMGTIDAAEQLWGLSGLQRLPTLPAPRDLINFLFHAGRQRGFGRLIPVA